MKKLRAAAPLVVVAALLALPAGLRAATVTKPPPSTEPLSFQATDDCRGGLDGNGTGTVTTTLQFVDTYPPTQGFYVRGTNVGVYRIDFSDGSYALGSFTEHFEGGGPITPQGTAPGTHSDVTVDRATVYDANGNALGTEIIHVADHTTVEFFLADNTFVVHVSFDKTRLTCSL